jgi:hypothetical protein
MIQGEKLITDTDERTRLSTIYPKFTAGATRCPVRGLRGQCTRPKHDLLMERHVTHDDAGNVTEVWFGARDTRGHGF